MQASELTAAKPPLCFRLFAIRHEVPFFVCLKETIETEGLVEQFNRLYGASLGANRQPIEILVDRATGKADSDMEAFIEFCWDCVFTRFGSDAETIWPEPEMIPELMELMTEYLSKKSSTH